MANLGLVSASTGAIKPLLAKLTLLLNDRAAKLKSSEREAVTDLKEELQSISANLDKSAMMEAPDLQVTVWMRQVREVTYDAEDYVDLFQARRGRNIPSAMPKIAVAAMAGSHTLAAFGDQVRWLGGRVSVVGYDRRAFSGQIRRIKDQISEANERHKRYKVPVDSVSTSDDTTDDNGSNSVVTIDPELFLMQHAAPVGIQGPSKLLHQRLAGNQKLATVTSIVGLAGIGKTTLAMHVYETTQEAFDCKVFIYVGRRTSVGRVLHNIISQVSRQQKDDHEIVNERDAMTQLRKLLGDKRYLVIMDDIWSISAWKAIICALPQNDLRSRILVTTRNHDVARSCSSHPSDFIYEVKTLDDSNSERLFHRRVFGSEETCPKECHQVHDIILKICGGLPLTIIVVASLLARTAKLEEWAIVHKSILSASEKYPLLQGMKKILHTSYMNLPSPIKTCFLYLGTFPKNYTVSKDRLIWRWIAEGFIPGTGEENKWETGRSYFNELTNRSLILPVFTEDEDDTVACKVHGAVHDFIVSLSKADNFVTLDEELESMPRDVIRRLSLNFTKQESTNTRLALESGSIGLSRARCLTVLGPAKRMPHLSQFMLLRVLDLEDAEGLQNEDLEDIWRLFNLKYLGLGGKHVTMLPESIGELQSLETLEMRRTKVRKMPKASSKLKKLIRILVQCLEDIPEGVEDMKDLQKVTMLSVNGPRTLNLVGELAMHGELRSLGVKWCFPDNVESNMDDLRKKFVSSLNKASASKITSLTIHSDEACSLGFLATSWDAPPYLLQKLVIKPSSSFILPRIPAIISSCTGLTYLEIAVNLDGDADVNRIANLPNLTILKLSVTGKPIVIAEGFQCLEVFSLQRLDDGPGLKFREGAMPLLRKLRLLFKPVSHEQDQDRFCLGLAHLHSLQQVVATIECHRAKGSDVVSAEYAIRKELVHKNQLLDLRRENEEEMIPNGGQCRDHLLEVEGQ